MPVMTSISDVDRAFRYAEQAYDNGFPEYAHRWARMWLTLLATAIENDDQRRAELERVALLTDDELREETHG